MKLLFALMLILLSNTVFCAPSEIQWHNYNEGIKKVKAESKPAIIDFHTDWCKWCKVMDEKTFNNPDVKKILMEDFISIRINPEKSKEKITYDGKEFSAMEFSSAAGVRGFPAVVFMDSKGKLITMLPGYVPAETFKSITGYIKKECYAQGLSFEDYVDQKGKCGK
ncbi:MAG: thioredoxin family protein [Fibrobacterota bacterium]